MPPGERGIGQQAIEEATLGIVASAVRGCDQVSVLTTATINRGNPALIMSVAPTELDDLHGTFLVTVERISNSYTQRDEEGT